MRMHASFFLPAAARLAQAGRTCDMPMQMALSLLAFTSAIGVAYAAGGIHSQMLHALGRYERGEPMECERPRSAKWWGAVSFGTLRQVAAEEPQLLGAAVRTRPRPEVRLRRKQPEPPPRLLDLPVCAAPRPVRRSFRVRAPQSRRSCRPQRPLHLLPAQ